MAVGEFDNVQEEKDKRVARTSVSEWGTGHFYNRRVSVPVGMVERATASGAMLALGAVMPDRFWKDTVNETIALDYPDSDGVGPEVPRLFEVRERQPLQGAIVQQLELVYLAIDPKSGETVTDGWVETARHRRDTQYTIEYDVWGVALTEDSTGIPALGDKMDSNTVILGGIYNDVVFDDERFPGRTMVHLHATLDRGYA